MREVKPRQIEFFCVAAVLLFTSLVYLPSVSFGFVADDTSQILANSHIHSAQYIPTYFTSHVWAQVAMNPGEQPAPYYRPVFLMWLLGNYLLFGYGTAGWHASVVLLHVLVTLLVYALAKRLTSDWRIAAAAALLFGVYPVHIEAVDWVSGASEPIMAAPFLAAIICYIESLRSRRSALWLALSVACYAAAIYAKETAIVLPAILIAYELLPRGNRNYRTIAGRVAWFAGITVVYLAMRSYALRGIHARDVPVSTFLFTLPSAGAFYIRHLLLPIHLSFFYNLSYVRGFQAAAVLAPLGWICLVLGFLLAWARVNRIAAFAAFWAAITILPPLYLPAFLQYELVHDRYLYLPSVGFCLLAAMAAAGIASAFPRWRWAAAGAVAVCALAYAALTVHQGTYWANEAALFTRSFEIGNQNWSAERNYAYALSRSGRCTEALPMLTTFAQRDSNDSKSMFALGSCYFHLGRLDEAESMMRLTAALAPHYQQPHLVMAVIKLQQGRLKEAADNWNDAVRSQGSNEELSVHYVHGEILKAQGDLLDAAEEFRKELQIQPGNREILSELASVESPGVLGYQ